MFLGRLVQAEAVDRNEKTGIQSEEDLYPNNFYGLIQLPSLISRFSAHDAMLQYPGAVLPFV